LRGDSGRRLDKRVKVLDSTAIILGFTEATSESVVTSRKILEEAKYGEAAYRALASREGLMIRTLEPKEEYVKQVEKLALEIGEKQLSEADVSILALALQLSKEGHETSIVTSDYSVQNLASILGIKIEPILHRGIRKKITWTAYCSMCHWIGDKSPGEPCPRCGYPLKRVPRRIEE